MPYFEIGLSSIAVIASVWCWAPILARPLRKRRAGPVVVDLGRDQHAKGNIAVGLMVALLGIVIAASGLEYDAISIAAFIAVASFPLSAAAPLVFLGRTTTQIAEGGILSGGGLMSWSRVESYDRTDLGGQESLVLGLKPRRGLRGLPPEDPPPTLTLVVPGTHREMVDRLLAKHVAGVVQDAGHGS